MSASREPHTAKPRVGEARAVGADGTPICYRTSGHGPPILLVHGTTADHTRWRPLLPLLEPHVTAHAVDRRGRGGSGDAAYYAVEREFEDVAAIVDRLAEESGRPVDVLAHSFGGFCTLGAALRTGNVRRLVLYEPPYGNARLALPSGIVELLQALLAAGDREGVVETFIREVVRMPDDEFAAYRALSAWPARVAAAHTIPRELAVDFEAALDPDRLGDVRVPTLMLSGGASPDWLRADTGRIAAALPDVQIVTLEGQQHIAIDLVPERFAREVLHFLANGG